MYLINEEYCAWIAIVVRRLMATMNSTRKMKIVKVISGRIGYGRLYVEGTYLPNQIKQQKLVLGTFLALYTCAQATQMKKYSQIFRS